MSEPIYADGLFYNNPSEKAPDFVLGKLSIQKEKFIEFLQKQEVSEKGYVYIDILKARSGKPYCKVNDFKPGEKKTEQKEIAPEDDVKVKDVSF